MDDGDNMGPAVAIIAIAAGAIIGAGASLQKGDREAQIENLRARERAFEGRVEVARLERLKRKRIGTIKAGFAKGGVLVGEGSPLLAETREEAEFDEEIGLVTHAADIETRIFRSRAADARRAGQIGVLTSLLGGAGKIASV